MNFLILQLCGIQNKEVINMARLKINLQDLTFAFLNDDPDIDPHLNLETGELIDNSSTYYGSSVTKFSGSKDEESAEIGEDVTVDSTVAVAAFEDEDSPKKIDEPYDEIADFDKFVPVKPLSDKGHRNIINEFIKNHETEIAEDILKVCNVKDFEYKIKTNHILHEKWLHYKADKFKFIAARWMEMNKIRADLI